MNPQPTRRSAQASSLRKRAEQRLQATQADIGQAPPADIQALVHELQIHRAELETQNEQLLESQRALAESEKKYRSIFENSPEIIVLVDARGNLVDVNDRAVELLQYTKEGLVGRHFSQLPFWSAETVTRLGEVFTRRLAGEEVPAYEVDFIRKDGRTLICQIRAALLTNAAGDVTHSLMIVSDVTEQKRTGEEIRHREAFGRILTRVSSELVDIGNLDAGIQSAIEAIGRFAVDRSYVLLLRAGGKTVDNTHEWCAEDVERKLAAFRQSR